MILRARAKQKSDAQIAEDLANAHPEPGARCGRCGRELVTTDEVRRNLKLGWVHLSC